MHRDDAICAGDIDGYLDIEPEPDDIEEEQDDDENHQGD